jgi:hypothetical protein
MTQRPNPPVVNRRHLLGGAGTAGALAAAAVLVPAARQEAVDAPALKPAPEQGGGYQVTEHVLRYYQTAKV